MATDEAKCSVADLSISKLDETQTIRYFKNQPYTHGVNEDVTELLRQTVEKFDENATLRIEHFQTVWKNMKFALVVSGITTNYYFLNKKFIFITFISALFFRFFMVDKIIENCMNLLKIFLKLSNIP